MTKILSGYNKDELLQVLITQYTQMYMKLAYAIGVPFDDVEDIVIVT